MTPRQVYFISTHWPEFLDGTASGPLPPHLYPSQKQLCVHEDLAWRPLGVGWEVLPSGVGLISLFDSSGQKGNRSSAERAGNCTHTHSKATQNQVRSELAKKQGWGALRMPRAQPNCASCEGPSPTALRTAASGMNRGELRTTEGLPNSSVSSCKAAERGKTISTRKPIRDGSPKHPPRTS